MFATDASPLAFALTKRKDNWQTIIEDNRFDTITFRCANGVYSCKRYLLPVVSLKIIFRWNIYVYNKRNVRKKWKLWNWRTKWFRKKWNLRIHWGWRPPENYKVVFMNTMRNIAFHYILGNKYIVLNYSKFWFKLNFYLLLIMHSKLNNLLNKYILQISRWHSQATEPTYRTHGSRYSISHRFG